MEIVWVAFITGLTTGGVSCLAVQGGLLASSIATVEKDENQRGIRPWGHIAAFLTAKLVSHIFLGLILGLIGATFLLSPKLMGTIQILAGLFMVWAALRLLDIHPIFRYGVIQPPRWVYRLLKGQSRRTSVFGPATLGFLTVLMPCGVTQATMAIAVATANPLLGAAVMAAFVLGTSPLFFALGASVAELLKRRAFSYAAALIVLVFAVLSINGGLGLRGSFYTIQNLFAVAAMSPEQLANIHGRIAGVTDGIQEVAIQVKDRGYEASATTLRAGIPVRLTLTTNNTRGCTRAFTIPELNITETLDETGAKVVEFTPTKSGRLAYACGMGMYTGAFTVVN